MNAWLLPRAVHMLRAPGPGRLLLTLFACASLSACWHQRSLAPGAVRPLAAPKPGVPTDSAYLVPGLMGSFDAQGDTARPIRVLLLHGMLTDAPLYSRSWQQRIMKAVEERFGARAGGTGTRFVAVHDGALDVERGYAPQVQVRGATDTALVLPATELRISRWHRQRGVTRDSVPAIVFYEVFWAPARDAIKYRYFGCFELAEPTISPACERSDERSPRPNDDLRTGNTRLKHAYLVRGFADASIVLGAAGDVLRDDVALTLCRIARDYVGTPVHAGRRCDLADTVSSDVLAALGLPRAVPHTVATALRELQSDSAKPSNSKFFAVTHSLGSYLLLDTQLFVDAHSSPKADSALAGYPLLTGSTVYMFANQVALLELGRLAVKCGPQPNPCPTDSVKSRGTIREDWRPKHTRYVAFNDVNDLLGYELPPYLARSGHFGQMVNVTVRNRGLLVPPLFKHPGAAHTKHWDNRAVIDAIVDGLPHESAPRNRPPVVTVRVGLMAPAVVHRTLTAGTASSFNHRRGLMLGVDAQRHLVGTSFPTSALVRAEWMPNARAAWISPLCPSGECAVPLRTRTLALAAQTRLVNGEWSVYGLLGGGYRWTSDGERGLEPVRLPRDLNAALLHVGARLDRRFKVGHLSLEFATYTSRLGTFSGMGSIGFGY